MLCDRAIAPCTASTPGGLDCFRRKIYATPRFKFALGKRKRSRNIYRNKKQYRKYKRYKYAYNRTSKMGLFKNK